jgi:hypothetical protein
VRERDRARQLSGEIDRMLSGALPEAKPSPAGWAEDDSLLATARSLRELGERLPPVPRNLERRVQRIVCSPLVVDTPRSWRQVLWGALAATLVLLAVWFVAPSGQQVWAAMRSSLLGQTRVELTPTVGPETRAVREPLRDLVAVELLIGRAPSVPRALPDGYSLQEIAAVSYPDLPSWISQPLFVELCYGADVAPSGFCLRQYRLLFRELGGIGGVQVADKAVKEFQQVELGGATGTLLTFAASEERPRESFTVLWERDGLLLELQSDVLAKDELLQVARSVR